ELETEGDDAPHIQQDGDEIALSCAGDLKVSAPRGASLTIGPVGGDLRVERLDGSVELSLVGGDVVLKNITGEVSLEGVIGGETQMENVGRITIGPQSGKVGADISARVQRRVDEALRRADRKIREAEQKVRRAHSAHLESRMPNIEQLRRQHPPQPVPPAGPREPSARPFNFGLNSSEGGGAHQAVSDAERMAILKMLQEKKITSEEADKLLAALEGGE
ncbi:MAG TPA: hypothetical protein VLZ89_00125, partial [Anaerolineales bacterium]|nr:hypothetical protein [Anaerolineales bacterium]